MPKIISTSVVYNGRVFDVRKDRIDENGSEYDREVITHKGSAVIVPIFDDGTVALVKQYRHPAGQYLLELPAGTLDHENEPPEEGARRELEEEIGVVADNFEKIAEFYVSPGFLSEKMHVFLATGLVETQQDLDDDEFVEIVRLPLNEAAEMARDGRIQDAKTMIGIVFTEKELTVRNRGSI